MLSSVRNDKVAASFNTKLAKMTNSPLHGGWGLIALCLFPESLTISCLLDLILLFKCNTGHPKFSLHYRSCIELGADLYFLSSIGAAPKNLSS